MSKKEKAISDELASQFGEGLYELTRDVENPHPDRRTTREYWNGELWKKGSRFVIRLVDYNIFDDPEIPKMERMLIAPGPALIKHHRLYEKPFAVIVHAKPDTKISSEGDAGDKDVERIAAILPHLENVTISTLQDVCDLYDLESDALFPTLEYLLKQRKVQLSDIIEAGVLHKEDKLWSAAGLQEDDNNVEEEEE